MSRFLSVPKTFVGGTLMVLMAVANLSAQDAEVPDQEQAPEFRFGMVSSLGNETIAGVNYQYLGVVPDFSYGPWGVGVDLSFHFRFYRNPTDDFGFYTRGEDWWDSDLSVGKNLDKYLARLAYVRYGKKGDPVYAQLGLLPSTTLGTGFIVSGYNNGALRPDTKLTGLNLDLSGSLVGVPWLGVESFVGNVSTFDLVGLRGYVKPFGEIFADSPILKETQFGVTAVADTNPYANVAGSTDSGSVVVFGADAMAPLVTSDMFTARATLDLTAEGANVGSALGVGGSAVQFLTWGLQLRALGDNFITNYFDQGYELSRADKYAVYSGETSVPGMAGWQASLGTSLLGDLFVMGTVFSAPFGSTNNVLAQPQLVGYAQLKPGVLPIDFNAFYLKRGVTSLGELISPEDALIGAKVGYTFGAVTITIVYDLHYGAVGTSGNNWVTTSRVETSVKMF